MDSFLPSTNSDTQKTLNDINRKMQEDEAKAKAMSLGLPYIDLHNFPTDLQVLGIFTEDEARQSGALPFYKEGSDLRIGATDPQNPLLLEKIKELSEKNQITLYFISKLSFQQILKFFNKIIRPKEHHSEVVRILKEQDFAAQLKLIQSSTELNPKSATEMLEIIFGASVFFKASDIHIEPEDHFTKVRFRIDGVLQDMLHVPKSLQHSLVTRIKILSKLKLNVENIPQDGRITFYYINSPVDVRVSTLPSAYGEEVVMRILGTNAVSLRLDDLGFRQEIRNIIEKALARPNGMIITTGPTGSGKTTSLYAFLNELNKPGVKIITLEDPVEYKLEGIVQTPIDHTVDFDFAKGLRAILRQDPDIIMVGEIRDQETAETALQAALTGHMVLSTLHTNDSAGAIPRLINMGVKPFIAAPALTVVLAQRLVRKICQDCKQPVEIPKKTLERIHLILKMISKNSNVKLPKEFKFYHSVGCAKCHNLGYKGRVGIYEALEVTEGVQKLILTEASMAEFKKAAIAQGMVTMVQDGLLKALEGITDIEEVFRVAGE